MLAKTPTKSLLHSSCSNFAQKTNNGVESSKKKWISPKESICLFDSLRDYLKTFDKASKSLQIPILKRKNEFRSTKPKDNLFAKYYCERQIRLSFRLGNNNSVVFSIKKFALHDNQFIITKIVYFNRREMHHVYKNRYYVANKCEIIERNYDV